MLCTIKYWRDNIPLNRSVGEPCSTLDESHSIDTASGWGCWHWQVPSWDSSDTFRMLLNGRSSQMRNSNRMREATRTKRARNSSFMRWNMVVINIFVLFHRITRSWAFLSPTSSFWLLLSRIRDLLDNRINQKLLPCAKPWCSNSHVIFQRKRPESDVWTVELLQMNSNRLAEIAIHLFFLCHTAN